jgi:hypothetical protein
MWQLIWTCLISTVYEPTVFWIYIRIKRQCASFLCRLYGVVATYRDHFSVVCPSVRPSQNLSGLLLINYSCNFIQTLQDWSVPSLVVHIVSIFRFNDFCKSYGPLIIFIFKICPDYFSYTTNAISMKLYRIDMLLKSLCILHEYFGWMIFGRVMAHW